MDVGRMERGHPFIGPRRGQLVQRPHVNAGELSRGTPLLVWHPQKLLSWRMRTNEC